MGKQKHLQSVGRLFQKSPVVHISSIARITGNKNYAKQLLHHLAKKGAIQQLTKGWYTNRDQSPLLVFCLQPAYIGLQSALSFYNLWEQETIPIIITTRKVRQGIRQVLGTNVMVRRIDKDYFFGIDYLQDGEIFLPYSDIEKTFIDLVYFKEYVRPDVLAEFRKRVDRKKIGAYLNRYPMAFRKKALNMLRASKSSLSCDDEDALHATEDDLRTRKTKRLA